MKVIFLLLVSLPLMAIYKPTPSSLVNLSKQNQLVVNSRGDLMILTSRSDTSVEVHSWEKEGSEVISISDLSFEVPSYEGKKPGDKIQDYQCQKGTILKIFSNGMAVIKYGVRDQKAFLLKFENDGIAYSVKTSSRARFCPDFWERVFGPY